MKRVLICGARDWTNRRQIRDWLEWLQTQGYGYLIEGEAKGADTIAKEEALNLGYGVISVPAKWEIYGRAAGPIRNAEMLTYHPDLVLAFHLDISKSKGTANMVMQTQAARVPVIVEGEVSRLPEIKEVAIG